MIGQIGPSVRAGGRRRVIGFHLLGGIVGGAAAGVVFGAAGVLVWSILGGSHEVAPLVLVAILVCAGISDLGLVTLPRVGMHRQTPGYWPCALGTDAAAFAWGLDLGLGVTTLSAYQAAVAIPVVAFLSGDLGIAVLFTAVYGASRAAAVGAVVLASNADIGDSCTVVSRATPALHRVVGVVALATATAVLVAS